MNTVKHNSTGQVECQRCGTCCRKGGPALHVEDKKLLESRILTPAQLITIRSDEPSYDPIHDKVLPAVSEFIKVGGQGVDWSCGFLDEKSNNCLIYQQRPLECCLLFCGDTSKLQEVIGRDLLTRKDILEGDDPVLSLIDRLEDECPYQQVNELIETALPDGQLEEITTLVRRDLAIRQAFLNHFHDREKDELFILGRPLFVVLAPNGIRLIEKAGNLDLEIVDQ